MAEFHRLRWVYFCASAAAISDRRGRISSAHAPEGMQSAAIPLLSTVTGSLLSPQCQSVRVNKNFTCLRAESDTDRTRPPSTPQCEQLPTAPKLELKKRLLTHSKSLPFVHKYLAQKPNHPKKKSQCRQQRHCYFHYGVKPLLKKNSLLEVERLGGPKYRLGSNWGHSRGPVHHKPFLTALKILALSIRPLFFSPPLFSSECCVKYTTQQLTNNT